ncbi:MAG: hypothetical protein AAF846_29305 [Chloroflexota bacterium]
MQLVFRAIGLTALALFVAACGTSINIENGELVVNSNFSVTETMLNSGDSANFSFGESDFIRDAEFDIQEGQLVVSGDVLCADSSRSAGSVTIAMGTTETGFIDVQITDVQADCEYDESLITEAQDDLATGLSDAARELEDSEATVTFTEVTLADDAIRLGLEVRAPMNSGNGN